MSAANAATGATHDPALDLKQRLARGDMIAMVNLAGDNADLMDSLKRYGADLAFIDCERTGIGIDTATQLIRAARAAGLPGVVRSAHADPATLVQLLDRKADGLVIPHVDSAEQARAIVRLVDYACGDDAARRLVIVQIETPAAVACVDELAQVQGVDAFLIGPNDLAYEMTGVRGARTAETERAIDHVCARLSAAGRRFGMPSRIEEMATFRQRGCTLLYYPVEWLLARALKELRAALA